MIWRKKLNSWNIILDIGNRESVLNYYKRESFKITNDFSENFQK